MSILFITYTYPLGDLLRQSGISYHFYADDMQLYMVFDLTECQNALSKMEECVEKVCIWMIDNLLKLNADKTEVLFYCSPNFLSKLQIALLTIGSDQIQPSDVIRNIEPFMDKFLNIYTQVSLMCISTDHLG